MSAALDEVIRQVAEEAPTGRVIYDEPGDVYYRRVPFEASNSALKIIDERSAEHYRDWLENGELPPTPDMVFGNVYHCLTLEPDLFTARYCIAPENAPKRPDKRQLAAFAAGRKQQPQSVAAIHFWQEWDAANAGRAALDVDDYDTACRMVDRLRRQVMRFDGGIEILGGELIDACDKEVTVRWIDPDTGLECKLRADLFSAELRFAGDLKSAADASKSAFSRAINQRRYHVQHAHYCEGFRAAGIPLSCFGFLAQEKVRPFAVGTWHIDAPSEARGWEIRQRSMRKLAACRDSGRFDGYTTTFEPIGIPAYGHYDADKD